MMINNLQPVSFLNGGGAMGALVRAKDWSGTSLGRPESWPQSLQTAVSILLNSQFPMFLWWGPDLATIYNDAYLPIAGEKHPGLLGRSGREAWAEIWGDLQPLVETVYKGQSTWSEDKPLLINRRGYVEEAYFTFSYSPIWTEKDGVAGLFCACIETTEKVLAARKIQESERNLRETILQAPVAMCILRGPQFVLEIANERMFELWGRGGSALLNRPIFEGVPEARNQGLEELLRQVVSTGEAYTAYEKPVQFPRAEGLQTVYVNFAYQPFREGDGTVSGVIAVAVDVTGHVTARQRVEESELKFRRLVEQAPVAMNVVKGENFVVDTINRSMLDILQKSAEDMLQKPLLEALPETRGQGFERLLQHVYRTGRRVAANEHPVMLTVDGKPLKRYLNFVYEPVIEQEGGVGSIVMVAVDVTEQVKARREIEERNEELQLAIAVADLGTFRVDLSSDAGQATYSQRIMDWFGFPEVGLPLSRIMKYIHAEDRDLVASALQRSFVSEENSRHDITYRVVHPVDGVLRYLRSLGRTYFTDSGEPYVVVGIIQNVTAQVLYEQKLKEAEAELQQRVAERTLELQNLNNELKRTNQNLEEFAYAASHDMKEPIRKIHLFTDRLKGELASQLTDTQQNLFARVENAAKRMNTLIEDLLTYSVVSRGMSHMEEVDLNVKMKNVMEDLEVEIEEKNAVLTIDPLPVIRGQKRQMQQLFQNLIGNSLKYSKPGLVPHIHIRYRTVRGSEMPLPLPEEAGKKQFHLIEVVDNGIGFEQEDAERIFQVFTRLHGNAEYKGTGVGLSIVKKVVENHQGYIRATSVPGEGTTFQVLLPV